MSNIKENIVLTGKINKVLFSFAIPIVLGLLAVSSAGIIDGIFIGNYIGETALAAATLCAPIFPILFGIAIMFSTGGEVFCGKFIGENNTEKASEVFTKVTIVIFVLSLLVATLGLIFIHPIANILGAGNDTHDMVVNYLRILIGSTPLITSMSLSFFVRVDGRPKLSSTALIITAILNIILDYIFIVRLNWGIKGAAWGTVLSYSAMPIMLLPHFLFKRGDIRFIKPTKTLKILAQIAYNGSSEFLSEISGGILMFIINSTMMKFYGTQGVAAYAVVGYLIYFASMAYYGISDSLKPIVSINYGAKEIKRVFRFLRSAIVSVGSIGLILIILTQINSKLFVGLFLKDNADITVSILANEFILAISPALVIIGTNIILSAYFTATHRARPSLIISLSRTLILPLILIPIFTNAIGGKGVITALILSETTTLIIAVLLLIVNKHKSVLRT